MNAYREDRSSLIFVLLVSFVTFLSLVFPLLPRVVSQFLVVWQEVSQAGGPYIFGHQRLFYTWVILFFIASSAHHSSGLSNHNITHYRYLPLLFALAACNLIRSQQKWFHDPVMATTYWDWFYSELLFFGIAFTSLISWRSDRHIVLRRAFFCLLLSLFFQIAVRSPITQWGGLTELTYRALVGSLNLVTEVSVEKAHFVYYFSTIRVGNFSARVLGNCSGIEGISIGLISLVGLFLLFRERLKFPQVLLTLPVAFLLFWAANIVRLVMLFLIGGFVSKEIAIEGIHPNVGWIFFQAVSLFILVVILKVRFFSHENTSLISFEELLSTPTAAYLLPLLALLATGLMTASLNYRPIDPLYGCKVLVGAAVYYWVRRFRFPLPSLREICRPNLTAVGIGLCVFAGWMLSQAIFPPSGSGKVLDPFSYDPKLAWVWITIWVVGSTTLIPLTEELAFRGYLLRRFPAAVQFEKLEYEKTSWTAVLFSSAAFGLVHGQIVGAFIAGIAFAWIARRDNSLGGAVISHGVANLLIAIWVISQRQWDWL